MLRAICPDCDADLFVDNDADIGDVITCEECETDLEVVSLDPLELDVHHGKGYGFDDDDDDSYDDDDDEDSYDDDYDDDYNDYDEDEDRDDRY